MKGAVDESSLKKQFCNWTRLPLLCEKSGAMLVGLTAGQQWDKILIFLKFSTDCIIRLSRNLTKLQCYYSVTNAFQLLLYCKVCYGGA